MIKDLREDMSRKINEARGDVNQGSQHLYNLLEEIKKLWSIFDEFLGKLDEFTGEGGE